MRHLFLTPTPHNLTHTYIHTHAPHTNIHTPHTLSHIHTYTIPSRSYGKVISGALHTTTITVHEKGSRAELLKLPGQALKELIEQVSERCVCVCECVSVIGWVWMFCVCEISVCA
jgi:hypothetical protein